MNITILPNLRLSYWPLAIASNGVDVSNASKLPSASKIAFNVWPDDIG
ncbi:hypothetical protein [Crocosphaera chwakensis]|nr:hypothetical protein [Crocosphaera chwakensis]